MKNAPELQLIAIAPWNDATRGIPPALQDHPQLGFVVPKQMRKVRAPVRVRLDHSGGYHLLGDLGDLLHLDAGGKVVGRTPLAARGERTIDYACDASGGCVLLEQIRDPAGAPLNRLRRLAPDGRDRWSHTGPVHARELDFATLRGTFTRLLLDGAGRLYLPAERHGPEVAEIDLASGGVRRVLHPRVGTSAVFSSAGRLLSVFFDDASNQRGIAAMDLDGDGEGEWRGGPEHFAWLAEPLGADDHSRLYAWRGHRVARISLRGEIEELAAIDGIAVRPGDQALFASHAVADGVSVTGQDRDLVLPAPAGYWLAHVDPQGRYYLSGGEAPGQVGQWQIYSSTGQLETSTSLPDNIASLECRVPSHDGWQVDGSGRIIIPVVTPEGVAIIALRDR